jgi:hypothetical protein
VPLKYLEGYETQVDAEYRRFIAAFPDDAADALALASQIAAAGWGGLDGDQRGALTIFHPHCHAVAGWGVFFEVEGPWKGRCDVTLLLVADLTVTAIGDARREASQRWQAAKMRGTGP